MTTDPTLNTHSRRTFIQRMTTTAVLLPLAHIAPAVPYADISSSAMPVCIFSKHLHWLKIPDMAKEAANMGYDGVDLTVRKGGHIEPENASQQLPAAVAQIRKAGLDVPMIATDIIDPDLPSTEAVLKAASAAGIKYYRTGYLNYDSTLGVAKSLEKFKKQLEKLAALNKKYNIHGAYQNHSGTRVGAAVWDLWFMVKDLDPRWMGVQYDPKHGTAEGAQSWIFDLDLLRNHIRCMDIKDFHWKKDGSNWKHQLVPLGEGMVDFKKYFGLVKQYGISGPISLHFEYDLGGADTGKTTLNLPAADVLSAMKRDLETLRKMLKEAGLN